MSDELTLGYLIHDGSTWVKRGHMISICGPNFLTVRFFTENNEKLIYVYRGDTDSVQYICNSVIHLASLFLRGGYSVDKSNSNERCWSDVLLYDSEPFSDKDGSQNVKVCASVVHNDPSFWPVRSSVIKHFNPLQWEPFKNKFPINLPDIKE